MLRLGHEAASTPQQGAWQSPGKGSRSPPHVADCACHFRDDAWRACILPNVRRRRDEVGAEAREPFRVTDAIDIPSDARNDENLGPPSDETSDLIDGIDAGLGRTEGHVVGTHLREAHGVVTAQAATGANPST